MNVKQYIIELESKVKELEKEVSRLTSELNEMALAKETVEKELSEVYLQKTELENKQKRSRKKNVEPVENAEENVEGLEG